MAPSWLCWALFLGMIAVPCALPTPGNCTQHPPLKKVTLQLRWFHQFQFAGYYAAKAQGYYEDVGLDVDIVQRDLEVNPVDAVLDGSAEFGVTNSEVLLHRLMGKPVVVLASIIQHSPLVLLTTKGNEIATPHDLRDKRVLMSTKTMDVELLGMLKNEDIPLNRINIIDRFSSKQDYFDPSIDALAAYITNEPYYLDRNGVSYNILYPSSYGIDFYGDSLFTTEEQVREHPRRTHAFLTASLKGWRYAMEHPEEIIDLILSEYETKKDRPHLVYEALAMERLMLPHLVEIGHMNPGRWEHIADVFKGLGVIDSTRRLDGFIYDPARADNALEHFLYVLGVVTLVLALGAIALALFNRRLQSQVQQRTRALSLKAEELEKANRRLTELDRVKSALLSSVSHEIRTPLTAVLGFVKLIGKEFHKSFSPLVGDDPLLQSKKERIDKNLNVISFEGERLKRLISDVLDLSKIESGKVDWRDQDIDLAELAYNSGAVVQEQFAQNPDTSLVMDIQDSLPTIHADPDRIVQVLINLLTNAGKFTAEGEVRLSITADGDGWVRLVVADTGIGVAEDDIEEIFNMFHQVRRGDTLKLGEQGAGLGLAICKEIVEHYGGTIALESVLGRGSRFIVSLPVVTGEAGS